MVITIKSEKYILRSSLYSSFNFLNVYLKFSIIKITQIFTYNVIWSLLGIFICKITTSLTMKNKYLYEMFYYPIPYLIDHLSDVKKIVEKIC